jgi:type IV pilus assembly protein PilA
MKSHLALRAARAHTSGRCRATFPMARALHERRRVGSRCARGFTLIEMMVVVVIVGILATLAVVGYRKLVQSSHVTEATNMVQSIRGAQEAYHSETLRYADISTSLSSWYPQTSPTGRIVTAWGGACGNCVAGIDWSYLPLHVDGPVMFGYATKAGLANSNTPTLTGDFANVTLPANPQVNDWYIVAATCDIDATGTPNTSVLTTSFSNQVFTFNEGL